MGLEQEYTLVGSTVHEALRIAEQYGVSGMTKEFFDHMVEVTTETHATPVAAVAQLQQRVTTLKEAGLRFGRYASYASGELPCSFDRVVGSTDYDRWVYHDCCAALGSTPKELSHVGVHISFSDGPVLLGDRLVHATNWLRCLNFLFVLVSANSPFQNGRKCGLLSRRSFDFPNRYDVPFWESEKELRAWIAHQEAIGRIFPGKARCWMTVCPRFESNDFRAPFERVELRSIDSGTEVPWEILEGCCELAVRIIEHALEGHDLPFLDISCLKENDRMTARLGRHARITFGGKVIPIMDLAWRWCQGIPSLEKALKEGSPAEKALQRGFVED